MERLKSVFFLSIVTLAATAVAEQTDLREPGPSGVTVIGDVKSFQTIAIPAGSAMTVRKATMKAEPLSESVNVTVIRSTQERSQWTQHVSAASVDSGESVECGDILVVQSMSPLNVPARKNAALRTDAGVIVVSLEEDGVVVGDILGSTKNLPLGEKQLKVIGRFQGQRPIAKAELYQTVSHGDVISISQTGPRVLKGFGSLVPTVSEFDNSYGVVDVNSSMPEVHRATESPVATAEVAAQAPQIESLPTDIDLSRPDETNTVNEATAETDSTNASSNEILAFPVSQLDEIADTTTPVNSTQSMPAAETVAPIAPQQMQMGAVTNAAASAFNPWSLVFFGGLLIAGTLILAGTLKPEPDDNTDFNAVAATATDLVRNNIRQQISAESSQPQMIVGAPSQMISETPAITMDAVVPASIKSEAPAALVSSEEWFSGDWRGRAVPRHLINEIVSHSDTENAVSCNEGIVGKSTSEIVEAAVESPREIAASAEGAAGSSSFQSLDDLIHNRLPIDLQETKLPLRVALFGKPAGPRRLRIDAAHSSIPAPHINSLIENRREQPVAASSGATSQTQVSPSMSDSATSGSLDKALHFLQERTIS